MARATWPYDSSLVEAWLHLNQINVRPPLPTLLGQTLDNEAQSPNPPDVGLRPEADIAPAPTWYLQVGRRHFPVPAHGRPGNIARRTMSHLPCSESTIGRTGRRNPIATKGFVPQGLSQPRPICENAKNVWGFGGIAPYPLAFRTTAGNRYCATVHRWPGLENPLL